MKNSRTDLGNEIIETIKEENGYKHIAKKYDDIVLHQIEILENDQEIECGNYLTLEFENINDKNSRTKIEEVLIANLKEYDLIKNLTKDTKILVVGLGNRNIVCDSLGPEVINRLMITNHMFELGYDDEKMYHVSALIPGVKGQTGLETSDIIKSIVDYHHIDLVIVIDALATNNLKRINKVIQVSDVGIAPGSGIGNQRNRIDKNYLGCNVMVIGVATVIDLVSITIEIFNLVESYLALQKEQGQLRNLIVFNTEKYAGQKLEKSEKKAVFGWLGELEDSKLQQLIFEATQPSGYNLVVTPKEIDEEIKHLACIIANSLNKAIHPDFMSL